MIPIEPISIDDIRAARERIAGIATRTPLLPLNVGGSPAEIFLKLENLQPIGSFKIRGAANALALASSDQLTRGVYTASAGNMAQGVGWVARQRGIPFATVVPDHAPQTKLEAIERLGGRIVTVPFETWWQVILEHHHEGMEGLFLHPVADRHVIAGNGTIGLEIAEDLPEVDTVLVPYGGGGLTCGIATAIRELAPRARVLVVEPETGAPVEAALVAGEPTEVEYTPSFVDGSGSKCVLEEMWPLVRELIDGSVTVSLAEVADAIRTLAERNRVIAEGAGALAVAAALSGKAGEGRVACVVSGGNIDAAKLATILGGGVP